MQVVPSSIAHRSHQMCLYAARFMEQIKLGILEVAEGLSFLHGHARIVHRNLSPESIFITQKVHQPVTGYFIIEA